MQNDVAMGKNRTGIALSPIDSKEMMNTAGLTVPAEGDETAITNTRAEFIHDGAVIGTVPPPLTVKGVAATGAAAIRGVNANVFVDKLGERLAFERTGTRLYSALVDKCLASEPIKGAPSPADLESIRNEELQHFELVREAIQQVGGDATAVTPSADVQGVASMGLLQVITDARMTLKQSLEAILVAELVDNECWTTLVKLARTAGQEEMATRFEAAERTEREHLKKVRTWVQAMTMG
jgi:hypothetical protein